MTLSVDAWLTIGVTLGTVVLLFRERFSPEFVLMGAVAVLLAGGVLSPVQALAGFSNTAVLTVAALFLVAAGLRETGAIRWIGAWVLGRPRGTLRAQGRLVGISSALSAFVNNTPVVAMLTSAVENWSRRIGVPASKLLLLLSYATILGGMCSLIGTSTNLIVLGLAQGHTGLPAIGMFTPAWVGVPAAIAGAIYLLTVGRLLLPDRRGAIDQAQDTRQYVLEMRVDTAGPLVGMTIADAGLRNLEGLFLAEIQRYGRAIPAPAPDMALQSGDQLVFVGMTGGLRELRQVQGLHHAETQVFNVDGGGGRHFVEVVLSRLSPVVGSTIRDARFRNRYDAVVVAVNRHGRQLRQKPGDVVLQAGDTLLLESTPGFMREHAQSHDFAMVHLLDDTPPVQAGKALISMGILGLMIGANALFHADIFVSALVAALGMLATRCLSLRHARHAVDISLIVTIACAFAIGKAITITGVATLVASLVLSGAHGAPSVALPMVYVMTVLFTELITNNAAAVLMFPIAMATAAKLGVHPMPFMMAVMIGASAAFITPIGYQTNLMVYGPGGYRFTDYVRVGLPLSLIVGGVVLWTIPHVWPF